MCIRKHCLGLVWLIVGNFACADTLQPTPSVDEGDDIRSSDAAVVPDWEDHAHDAGTTDVDAGQSSTPAPPPARSGMFEHEPSQAGSILSVVDAADADAWQRLDLDSGRAVTRDEDWDLAFSRFRVRTNSGVSGSGGVRAAVSELSFESISRVPEVEWRVDEAAPSAEDVDPDFVSQTINVFHGAPDATGEEDVPGETSDWYDYEGATHTLTPKARTFLIASTADRYFKLHFLSYYDDAGSPAVIRFEWAELDHPDSF